jgi:hypothetical protein
MRSLLTRKAARGAITILHQPIRNANVAWVNDQGGGLMQSQSRGDMLGNSFRGEEVA